MDLLIASIRDDDGKPTSLQRGEMKRHPRGYRQEFGGFDAYCEFRNCQSGYDKTVQWMP